MNHTPNDQATIEKIAERLSPDSRVLFVTGAGMSAESGLPTYRGIGGLYNREHTEEGIPIEDALSCVTLHERPELCWKYLAEIGRAALASTFNRGHQVIAEMEDRLAHTCVLTQNVDGYHRAAGSKNVIEIHGSMDRLYCMECGEEASPFDMSTMEIPPRCPECGSVLRPDVVLFGEMLSMEKINHLTAELEDGFDVVFSIGTTSVFSYIAQPVFLGRELGWTTVEINPSETRVSGLVDYRLPVGASVALEAIWELVRRQ